MKRLALVAAVAALSAACTPPTDGSGAPAEREGGAAETPATSEAAAAETPGAPTTEDIQSTEPLTISEPTVAQIEGYWWNNGDRAATFRAGRYVDFKNADLSQQHQYSYESVENCQSRTPNADGRGIILVDDLCYDVVTVENDVLQLVVPETGGSTFAFTLTRVTGAEAAALEERLAVLPPQ